MTEAAFRIALRNGLGRALIFARDNDMSPFREAILNSCLHCHAAEPICEGTRAPFVHEILEFLPDRDFFRDEILRSLAGAQDDWHSVHRFRLATYFAMDGDAAAKEAVYRYLPTGPHFSMHAAHDLTASTDSYLRCLISADSWKAAVRLRTSNGCLPA